MRIVICTDFSDTPGGRFIHEGDFSGEQFRESVLLPAYEKAVTSGEMLEIDFDGCFGFGTSFLEEAFGGLVRVNNKNEVLRHIIIKSTEDETIPELIEKYVTEAEKKRR